MYKVIKSKPLVWVSLRVFVVEARSKSFKACPAAKILIEQKPYKM